MAKSSFCIFCLSRFFVPAVAATLMILALKDLEEWKAANIIDKILFFYILLANSLLFVYPHPRDKKNVRRAILGAWSITHILYTVISGTLYVLKAAPLIYCPPKRMGIYLGKALNIDPTLAALSAMTVIILTTILAFGLIEWSDKKEEESTLPVTTSQRRRSSSL